ncbi:class I SAM-dependent methyltransferase [Pseudodesulfovibrio sp. JC047]|uniref:class I SAM-dependent methyltransferase n=1 Tax=Pseudodesulfovibrio sp. JC047 TaxID=2683199 RepID=UPI0013D07B27|nr:class I SAM-dependent methyltransferase [Pseudodesulfovibrio sp. JC047]NDV18360.1 class I SAM-dependent methyltransferase [Pseudodesulfovibrio sp. JC047]
MHTISTDGISDAVADTLFITLYMRCLETQRSDRIINDPEACRMVETLKYDFSVYDAATRSQIGTCIRVRTFDTITTEFIETHADPVIVNLGCGLDTRSNRIGLDKGVYYNIDLPEVMELRDILLPPDDKNISIHTSLFDMTWMRDIRNVHPDADILVLSEGVLMYFTEAEIRPVLEEIARILSPGELVFDACTDFGCKMSSRHDTIKHTNARFQWGLNDNTLPEQWAPNIHLHDVSYYMHQEKHRWDTVSKCMAYIPAFAKAFKMLHYTIAPARA